MINVSERLFADHTVRTREYSKVNFAIFGSLINTTGPLITSPLISYYEGGGRSVPMLTIEKLASLFGVDAYDLFEENASLHTANNAFAFIADDLLNTDLEQIAQFRKIVKNYVSMKNLAQNNEIEKGESSGS